MQKLSQKMTIILVVLFVYSHLPDIGAQLPPLWEILDLPLTETLTFVDSCVCDGFFTYSPT